jgi:hypothetical protein
MEMPTVCFRKHFGKIRVLFINKMCLFPRQDICIYVGYYFYEKTVFGLIISICIWALSWDSCVEAIHQMKCTHRVSRKTFTTSGAGTTYPSRAHEFSLRILWSSWYSVLTPLSTYFSYIMATSFSSGRSRSTWREPLTMGKQLVNFIDYIHFVCM